MVKTFLHPADIKMVQAYFVLVVLVLMFLPPVVDTAPEQPVDKIIADCVAVHNGKTYKIAENTTFRGNTVRYTGGGNAPTGTRCSVLTIL